MAVTQRVGKGVQPRVETVGGVGHQLRHQHDSRADGGSAARSCQHEPPQPGTTHEHEHRANAQNQHRAGKVGLQQHEHRHYPQHQRKGHHPHRKAVHAVVVQSDDVSKYQYHRKFGDFAGL